MFLSALRLERHTVANEVNFYRETLELLVLWTTFTQENLLSQVNWCGDSGKLLNGIPTLVAEHSLE